MEHNIVNTKMSLIGVVSVIFKADNFKGKGTQLLEVISANPCFQAGSCYNCTVQRAFV